MPKAIRIYSPGGPEVMKWEEVETPTLAEGDVLVRQKAVGLNYIDIYHRSGLYPLTYPTSIGVEGAGVVEAVGPAVIEFAPGDRVAYSGGPVGAYAQLRSIPEKFLVKIPDALTFEQAAALMVKGMTAHFLVRRTFAVAGGHTVLVHAAAGGVGLLLCQWAKHLGATVIGTVGSEEKAALAKANGCDYPIIYTKENIVEKVLEYTQGRKCNAVYDSVGKDTFMDSLDSLMHFGLMVSYGQSSGPIPPFDISLLVQKGSLFLTRPSVMHYKADRDEYVRSAEEIFDLALRGILKIYVKQSYYLSDAVSAHRDLEARKTQGATILLVDS